MSCLTIRKGDGGLGGLAYQESFHLALLPRPALVLLVRLLIHLVGEVEEDDVGEPAQHQLLHLVRNLQQFWLGFGHHPQTFTTSKVAHWIICS